MRTMNAFCLLLCFVSAAALEARWTPAADGGPARFSKRYRDAAGIDDSRWTEPDAEEGVSTSTLLLAGALVRSIRSGRSRVATVSAAARLRLREGGGHPLRPPKPRGEPFWTSSRRRAQSRRPSRGMCGDDGASAPPCGRRCLVVCRGRCPGAWSCAAGGVRKRLRCLQSSLLASPLRGAALSAHSVGLQRVREQS